MPNKPTTLKEEFLKMAVKHHPSSNEYFINASPEEIADWWLSKFDSHNTELLKKIEEEIVEIRKIWESYDEYEKIINIAKIETLEKVINLINQEK